MIFPDYLSKECKVLLEGLLQREPSKRIGCKKINNIDWNEIKNCQWFGNFEKITGKINLGKSENSSNDWFDVDDPNIEYDPLYHVSFNIVIFWFRKLLT